MSEISITKSTVEKYALRNQARGLWADITVDDQDGAG